MITKLGDLSPGRKKNSENNKASLTSVKDPKNKHIKQQEPSDSSCDLPVENFNRSAAKSYIQLGLFFLILSTVLVWGILLYKKRKYLTGLSNSKTKDFPEKISSSSVFSSLDKMSLDLSAKEELEDKVYSFASLGFCVEEIAKQLGLGKGEVRLMLNYKEKKIPMEAPQMRIEMDG